MAGGIAVVGDMQAGAGVCAAVVEPVICGYKLAAQLQTGTHSSPAGR